MKRRVIIPRKTTFDICFDNQLSLLICYALDLKIRELIFNDSLLSTKLPIFSPLSNISLIFFLTFYAISPNSISILSILSNSSVFYSPSPSFSFKILLLWSSTNSLISTVNEYCILLGSILFCLVSTNSWILINADLVSSEFWKTRTRINSWSPYVFSSPF